MNDEIIDLLRSLRVWIGKTGLYIKKGGKGRNGRTWWYRAFK